MSKLARKFILSLSGILMAVIFCSLYLNSNFIERYFLYQEKQDLRQICDRLADSDQNLAAAIKELEHTEDVVIAYVTNSDDNVLLNERLRTSFLEKGLGIDQYWLWDQDQDAATQKGRVRRIYHQEKLHYSLLVEYMDLGEHFIAAAKIIPSMEQTIPLINQVTAAVFFCASLVMILFIAFLVRKITIPLSVIGEATKAIANLDFAPIEVKTGDELELLAENINQMSDKLKTAHAELEHKNRQMESLLSNVSHDLKTPVALIKAYTSGMKDDMDDGTFLDTVIMQNEKMEHMIERLLDFAKISTLESPLRPIDISAVLSETIEEFQIQATSRGFTFTCEIEAGLMIMTSLEAVQTVFSNLLSNSIKYASEPYADICLRMSEHGCLFEISNPVNSNLTLETDRLWEPFYVAEKSRNKNMSGTGLGLSIVRAISQKYGYGCDCDLAGHVIRFSIRF